jgi:hypothetical protein
VRAEGAEYRRQGEQETCDCERAGAIHQGDRDAVGAA